MKSEDSFLRNLFLLGLLAVCLPILGTQAFYLSKPGINYNSNQNLVLGVKTISTPGFEKPRKAISTTLSPIGVDVCKRDSDCMWCGNVCVYARAGLQCMDVGAHETKCVCGADGRCGSGEGPDLVVDRIELQLINPPQSPCPQYQYIAYIKNIGSRPARKSYLRTKILPDQPQRTEFCTEYQMYSGCHSAPIPGNNLVSGDFLPPGEMEKYSDYFNPSESGEVMIEVTADIYDNVSELDESNNTLSKSFSLDKLFTLPTNTPPEISPKCSLCDNEIAGQAGKNVGDANCNGSVEPLDYTIWVGEYLAGNGQEERNSWVANFTCSNSGDKLVNSLDLNVLLQHIVWSED